MDLHPVTSALAAGEPIERADRAMILVHGRGSSASDILSLVPHLALDGFACLAPQASGHTWYPNSFLAPEARNQPHLDAALAAIHALVARAEEAGVPAERVFFLGFSQGACLALESAARNPRRYGGIFALSGGLIGLGLNRREYTGDFGGTPVVMGCSDTDPHIPKDRVLETADVMRELGAQVDATLYTDFGHTINQDELDRVNRVLSETAVS
jgi:predicted esterase